MTKVALRAGSTEEFRELRSPYGGEVIAEVEQADAALVDRVLARQTALFADRAQRLPHHERAAILRRAARLAESRLEDLALQVAREGG